MFHYYEVIEFYPYPTACGYRCWDGDEDFSFARCPLAEEGE